jgi:hypothetical protein
MNCHLPSRDCVWTPCPRSALSKNGRVVAGSWQARGKVEAGNDMGMAWYIESGFTVVVGDFEFDIELLLSLVGARPVLWVKTDDIYKNRIENKKTWKEVCIWFQEDFEALQV